MELVELTFQNINALAGTWTINFRKLATAAEGLFAIVGPTGSGKTSLLDAVSLALFGGTPRASREEEKVKYGQDFWACITKGYTTAKASLTFLHEGHCYKTQCTLTTQQKREFVLEKDGLLVSDKREEALAEVRRVLKMDYATFNRTLMLAQGHFNRFLVARPEDRLETLSTIAGKETFDRIEMTLRRRRLDCENAVKKQEENYRGSMEMLLSEAEVAAKQAELADIRKAIAQDVARMAELDPVITRWKEMRKLRVALEETQAKVPELQAHEKATQERKAEAQKQLDALQAEPRRKRLSEACEARKARERCAEALREANETLAQQKQALQEADASLNALKNQAKDAEKAQEERLFWLQAHEVDKGLAKAVPELESQARQIQEAHTEVARAKRLCQTSETALEKAIAAQKAAVAKETSAQEAAKTAKAKADAAEQLAKQKKADKVALEKAYSAKDRARLEQSSDDSAWEAWREDLPSGQPCPLCGSTSHPYIDTPETLARHQEELARWQAHLEALEEAQENLEAAVQAAQTAALRTATAEGAVETARVNVATTEMAVEPARQTAAEDKARLVAAQAHVADVQKAFAEALQAWGEAPAEVVPETLRERQKLYFRQVSAASTYLTEHAELLAKQQRALEAFTRAEAQHATAEARQKEAAAAAEKATQAFAAFGCEDPEGQLEALEQRYNALVEACTAAQEAATIAQARLKTTRELIAEQQKRLQAETEGLPEDEKVVALEEEKKTLEATLQTRRINEGGLQSLLKSDAEKRQENAKKLAELEQLRAKWEAWEKLWQIMGNDALKKIAQNVLLINLLEIANQRLKRLLPRYQLVADLGEEWAKAGASGRVSKIKAQDIQIEDEWFGGELRPTTNLSGGESFLISLVLAISLSDITTQHFQLKNLFLDEGFGTLDNDRLQDALEILGNLRSEGRLVGIISHVEQFKNAPVRIEVQPSASKAGFSTLACYVNDVEAQEIVFGDPTKTGSRTRKSRGKAESAQSDAVAEETPEAADEEAALQGSETD